MDLADDTAPGALRHHLLRHPSGLLLGVQLLGIVVYPFMEGSKGGRAAFEAFGLVVLALVVWLVSDSQAPTWIGAVLAAAAAATGIADAVAGERWLAITSGMLHAGVYFFATTALIAYMLGDRDISLDDLFAVGATFTLLAWAFAYAFRVAQILEPHAFTAAVNPDAARTWTELLFLSVTTLTSTGLSDVVPITAHARSFVMIEQILGMVYVAMVISRVVGLTMRRAPGGWGSQG